MPGPLDELTTDPWDGMPAKTFKRLGRWLREQANTLGPHDWTLVLSHEPAADPDAGADIAVLFGRRHATIHLARDFATESPEDQRHYLTHELLHIHLDPCDSLLRQALPDALGTTAWKILEEAQRERIEHAVDALAAAIAPMLPLPKTGKR